MKEIKTYEDLKTKNFIPIIPEPEKIYLQNEFVNIENKTFNLNTEIEIISNLQNIIYKLDINFTSEKGFPIFFKRFRLILSPVFFLSFTIYLTILLEFFFKNFLSNLDGKLLIL